MCSSTRTRRCSEGGADTRAKVRGDVERSIAEVNALIAQVNAWIASPAATRTPRTRRTAQQVVTASTAEVQKAGSAMQAEDYAGAQKLMTATKERLQKVLPAAPTAAAAQSTRRGK